MTVAKKVLASVAIILVALWAIGHVNTQPTAPTEGQSMMVNGQVKYCTAADLFDQNVRKIEVTMWARFDHAEAHRRAVMVELAALSTSGNAPCVMGRRYDAYGNQLPS